VAFPTADDERRREPGEGQTWCEAFSFEFFGTDGVGGFLTLVLLPNRGRSWLWACGAVGGTVGGTAGGSVGGEPVTVVDNDLPLPAGLAISDAGGTLAVELRCERPLERWAATFESEPLALELRFDTIGEPDVPPFTAYAFPCRVHGVLRVGAERREIDVFGARGHLWGEVDWSRLGTRVIGRLDDGGWLVTGGPGPGAPDDVTVHPVASTVVPATGADGSPVGLRRELCRVRTTDGRPGWGWLAGLDHRA
jgi:hypothetical protein